MQFKVPQNVSLEDRIVGQLTLIQFLILVVGGGISFLVYSAIPIPPFNVVLGGVLAALTLTVVFGRFNDQPMYRFFKSIIIFIVTPKIRVWHKAGKQVQLVKPVQAKKDEQEKQTPKNVSKQDIARLASLLDSRGSATTPIVIDPNKK